MNYSGSMSNRLRRRLRSTAIIILVTVIFSYVYFFSWDRLKLYDIFTHSLQPNHGIIEQYDASLFFDDGNVKCNFKPGNGKGCKFSSRSPSFAPYYTPSPSPTASRSPTTNVDADPSTLRPSVTRSDKYNPSLLPTLSPSSVVNTGTSGYNSNNSNSSSSSNSRSDSNSNSQNSSNISNTNTLWLERNLRTHLGNVKLKTIGDDSEDSIPVIALPGANRNLIDEWLFIADHISHYGYVVYIIFVEKEKKKKGTSSSSIDLGRAVSIIYDSLLRRYEAYPDKPKHAIIMGKSAGGILAQSFARYYPKDVAKLVLICPAASDVKVMKELSDAQIKLFLAWAEDDHVAPFAKANLWTDNYQSHLLTFYPAKIGGHAILKEYADPLLKFLKS